jgi:hypothetical protein
VHLAGAEIVLDELDAVGRDVADRALLNLDVRNANQLITDLVLRSPSGLL